MTIVDRFFKAVEGKEFLSKRDWLKLSAELTENKESAINLRNYLCMRGYTEQVVRLTEKGKARIK